mgnify:CR=1 FL=1
MSESKSKQSNTPSESESIGDWALYIGLLRIKNQIQNENVFVHMKKAEAFILSSLWEDPGYVLIEAAMANATIISSNCPNGPSEILDYGKSGYLFKSNNLDDFSSKFDEFLSSNSNKLYEKKLSAKKAIKIYTIFGHYNYLKKYLNL